MGILNALSERLRSKLREGPHGSPTASVDRFPASARTYNQDGLITMHDCAFINDRRFKDTYRSAIEIGSWSGPWGQTQFHRKAHFLWWLGQMAKRLPGEFRSYGDFQRYTESLTINSGDRAAPVAFDGVFRRMRSRLFNATATKPATRQAIAYGKSPIPKVASPTGRFKVQGAAFLQ